MIPDLLNGALRVYAVVGDPIAQVKSPAGVTQALRERGHNAIVVPFHVPPSDLATFFAGMGAARNVDGAIITVPHKFAAHALCASASDRAHFLEAVNVMRRAPDGRWHGDMFDGVGFVTAMRAAGADPRGKRVLLVGAGGAGSAIAHAIVTSGAAELAIHDDSSARRDALITRLSRQGNSRAHAGGRDPSSFDIVLNATPAGMREGDPLPVDASRLRAEMFVGDVITAPAVTPLLEAARRIGCDTIAGADMFARVRDLMVDFLVGSADAR